jgi:hypothetical protein
LPTWLASPNVRAILELAYFASGVVIACASVVLLYQLWLAKQTLSALHGQLKTAIEAVTVAREDIRIRSQREAVELAADRCEKFAEYTLPQVNVHLDAVKNQAIQFKRWGITESTFDDTAYTQRQDVRVWMTSVDKNTDTTNHILKALNLEAFAIYFARGAADEGVAYPVVGPIFCVWVEQLAPHLIAMRTHTAQGVTSGAYQNTVELYKVWSARSRRTELEKDKSKIDKALSRLPAPEVRPIGTE